MTPAQDFDNLRQFLEALGWKDFFLPAIAACIGSFSAFLFATFYERRRALLDELASATRAFSFVYGAYNSAHNFKMQIVLPKYEELNQLTRASENIAALNLIGQPPAAIFLQFRQTFLTLQPIEFMSSEIISAVSQLRYISGRPIVFAGQLAKSTMSINYAVNQHNLTIGELKSVDNVESLLAKVTGTFSNELHVDETFRHQIDHMSCCRFHGH
jgi:hypothetical protein